MPNHVTTTLTFEDMPDTALRPLLFDRFTNKFDFGILVPVPPNVWMGHVELRRASPSTLNALDWCSLNWGTKWNAYGACSLEKTNNGNGSVVEFNTAWGIPYPWLTALFKAIKKPFSYKSDNEGESFIREGVFFFDADKTDTWDESETPKEPTP